MLHAWCSLSVCMHVSPASSVLLFHNTIMHICKLLIITGCFNFGNPSNPIFDFPRNASLILLLATSSFKLVKILVNNCQECAGTHSNSLSVSSYIGVQIKLEASAILGRIITCFNLFPASAHRWHINSYDDTSYIRWVTAILMPMLGSALNGIYRRAVCLLQ
jgi:hypothetical protein